GVHAEGQAPAAGQAQAVPDAQPLSSRASQTPAEPRPGRWRPGMSLTPDEGRWIAHLARLELTDQELALFTRQLGEVLDYVRQLQTVNTDGVEPLAHPLPLQNVFRP